ncbi:MAG: collagen-like protein [Oscillospiraceae bacterium]|nr:collagen-like protein [Oscillospiraceae bacterium]
MSCYRYNPCCLPKLIPGPPGVPGHEGATGATGPQGARGPGYPFNLLTAYNPNVQPLDPSTIRDTRIQFTDTTLAEDPRAVRIDPSTFEITEEGIYRIYYKFIFNMNRLSVGSYWMFALYINNSPEAESRVKESAQYTTHQDEIYVRLDAGDIVYVQLSDGAISPGEVYEIQDAYISFEKAAD